MKHALIVGGTGMLSDVSLWLISEGYHTTIIGRKSHRMNKLLEQTSKNHVSPLLLDYADDEELRKKLNDSLDMNGPIDLVIAWIHSYAENALAIICEEVANHAEEWTLFHILGSSSNLQVNKKKAPVPSNCSYHQIQLGFVIEKNHSRWLKHKEISQGVIDAIKINKKIYTVGTLRPWSMRP